jgi:Tfp pilus assembly protein PilX
MRKRVMMGKHKNQYGAVSLFIVIFAALLITVVTVGFIRLMLADQQQASNNDLSQSAYDSAQAGVEDAKRALLRYQNICATGDTAACAKAYTDIVGADKCNQGLVHIIDSTSLAANEVQVKQTATDAALNQAYTCVKIQPQTDDYLGTLAANGSNIVPLKSQSDVTSVVVEWYSNKNISNSNLDVSLLPLASIPISGTPPTLHPPLYDQTANGWGPDRPSIMRAQLMQFGSNFSLTDFDNTNAVGESDANTLFLYPTGIKGTASGTTDEVSFSGRDTRLTGVGAPLPVTCSGTLSAGGYACSVKLDLPNPIGGGTRSAFLRLTPLYNATDYRVTLYNGAAPVQFDAVQPEIDSTGRADNLFRRVKTRVELLDTSFAYPDAAVDITGSLCKNFIVTDKASDYANSCTP